MSIGQFDAQRNRTAPDGSSGQSADAIGLGKPEGSAKAFDLKTKPVRKHFSTGMTLP